MYRRIKKQPFESQIVTVLFLLLAMLLYPCMAQADPPDDSGKLKIEKIFSMKEPWTLKDLGQKFSQMVCKKTQYESRVVRKVIMINSNENYAGNIQDIPNRAVVSFATIGNEVGVSSTDEGSIKAARKKLKSVKDLESITFPKMLLGEDLTCTVSKDKKSKEYSLSCPRI